MICTMTLQHWLKGLYGGKSYDEAKNYFDNEDKFGACNVGEITIDDATPHEFTFHADGVASGDGSDTMLNWCKVDCCY